jgi:hypothetical protein
MKNITPNRKIPELFGLFPAEQTPRFSPRPPDFHPGCAQNARKQPNPAPIGPFSFLFIFCSSSFGSNDPSEPVFLPVANA